MYSTGIALKARYTNADNVLYIQCDLAKKHGLNKMQNFALLRFALYLVG